MSIVEKLKIGSTSYDVRDVNTYRSLSTAQETTLLSNGTYNGESITSGTIFTCEDGALKQYSDIFAPPTVTFAEDNKTLIATAVDETNNKIYGISSGGSIWESTDGDNWTELSHPTRTYSPVRANMQVFEGKLWLMETNSPNLSTNGNMAIYSYDINTATWQKLYFSASNSNPSTSIAVGRINNELIILARSGTWILTSTDGGSYWYVYNSKAVASNAPIKYLNGKFVTSDGFGKAYYATAVSEWKGITVSDGNVGEICYDGSKFVITTDKGIIYTSTDLESYSSISKLNSTVTAANCKSGIGFSNSVYIALMPSDSTGKIYKSTDLLNWTEIETSLTIDCQADIGFVTTGFNNRFFFVGSTISYKGTSGAIDQSSHSRGLIKLSSTKAEIETKNYLVNTSIGIESIDINNDPSNSKIHSVTLGVNAIPGEYSISIGNQAKTTKNSVSIGYKAGSIGEAPEPNPGYGSGDAISIGNHSNSDRQYIYHQKIGKGSVAIGSYSNASGSESIAIGEFAKASADYAIQLGGGENSEEGTIYFRNDWENYKLLNRDGTIPTPRLYEVIAAGEGDPTEDTEGTLGLIYKNTLTGELFRCSAIEEDPSGDESGESDESYIPIRYYTWVKLADASDTYSKDEIDIMIGNIEARLAQV